MAKIVSSPKTVSFVYDFATDGGAISTIGMGVFLPINAVVWFGYAKVITTLVSGGSATIAVGWTGSTGSLITATAVATWVSTTPIIPGVDLPGTPVLATAQRELAVTIATATIITAGKFVYVAYYTELNV